MILGHALALAINRFDTLYRAMKPPLSLTQLIILQAIEDGKDMREGKLAEKVGLEDESVRLVLHRIYKRKFFRKVGRRKLAKLYITPAGKDAVERSAVLAARIEVAMLNELPFEQRITFLAAMTTLSTSSSQTPSLSVLPQSSLRRGASF